VSLRACAPLRISFAGGGTDVPPYPSSHGGAVLSATIARCARAQVRIRADHDYHVESLDLMARAAFARDELVFDGHLDLVKAVLRDLAPEHGLDLTLATDAPPGSGLGSSSALVVAMLAADRASRNLGIELVELAAGRAVTRMRITPDMVNGHAIAHGAFVFAVADTAFACACNSHGPVTVAASAAVTFVAPAREGDELTAEAVERTRYGRNGVYDVTVRRGEEVIAEFRGISHTIGESTT